MPGTKNANQSSLASNRNQDQGAAGKVAEGRLPWEVGPAASKGKQLAKETRPGKGRARKGAGQEEDRTWTHRPAQAASDHQRLKAQAWDTRGPQKHQWRGTCTSQ